MSTPTFGMCPIGRRWRTETLFMKALGRAKMHAFDSGHGFYFWNFKTELEDRWDYMQSTEKGYFPERVDKLEHDPRIIHACDRWSGFVAPPGLPEGIFAEIDGVDGDFMESNAPEESSSSPQAEGDDWVVARTGAKMQSGSSGVSSVSLAGAAFTCALLAFAAVKALPSRRVSSLHGFEPIGN